MTDLPRCQRCHDILTHTTYKHCSLCLAYIRTYKRNAQYARKYKNRALRLAAYKILETRLINGLEVVD